MRGGRPSMRAYFRQEIVTLLNASQYPVTTHTLRKSLESKRGKPGSWHTVRKYLYQLSDERIVCRQVLPVERGRKPLVLFALL